MRTPRIYIIVGLPGSGKSHYIKSVKERINGICADDYMRDIDTNNLIKGFPGFTDSLKYRPVISSLRKGKSCIISDIMFCDTLSRMEAEKTLMADVPGLEIEWIFYKNQPKRCIKNVKRRKKKVIKRQIKLVKFLSKRYFIPRSSFPFDVWKMEKY